MKKIIFAILFALVLNTTSVFAFYLDVPEDHQYYDSIKYLYENAYLTPEQNNLFFPDKALKADDLYKILIDYGKTPLSSKIDLPFTDFSNTGKNATYIQTAIDLGLLETNSKTLDLHKSIAKHQALSTMFKALGISKNYFDTHSSVQISDLSVNSPIYEIAEKALEIGIIETNNPSAFRMAKRITKAEAAYYLHKIDQYQKRIPSVSLTVTSPEHELAKTQEYDDLVYIYQVLKEKYYYKDEIDEQTLLLNAIQGMVRSTSDIYTSFELPANAGAFIDSLSSEYEGIGIMIEYLDGFTTIITPFPGSPAEEAGLKPADIIIAVDGIETVDLDISEVAALIKGPIDSTVDISVLREKRELTLTVRRETIHRDSVVYKKLTHSGHNYGHIKVNSFSQDTYNEFINALEEGKHDGIKGAIIDVRNNPGGYMDIVVAMLDLLAEDSLISVIMEYSDGRRIIYESNGGGKYSDLKFKVLVNGGSASASEILAGALQDHGIAEIYGTQSFGKGSVQEIYQFANGSLFKFTIANWLTPNGNHIEKTGITPDILIEDDEETEKDEQLERALRSF